MVTPSAARRAYGWHRPLALLAAGSLVLAVACAAGLLLDDRVLTGAPIWEKPLKFSISIAVYAVTLAWLVSLLDRWRRLGWALGTVSAVMLTGELVAIVTQVVRGRTSHFDFATTFDATVYEAMAVMIATLWLANLALVVVLLGQRQTDAALTWALRLGLAIAVVGMGLAYLMTLPTAAQQRASDQGAEATVIGAHTVGLPDGGPGLPLLGWSTVGGDLRIPHFVGLHGLQVMILLALFLGSRRGRSGRMSSEAVRVRLVLVTAAAYGAFLAVLTWQALRGQSVVHPDALTMWVTAAVVVGALTAYAGVLRQGRPEAVQQQTRAATPGRR